MPIKQEPEPKFTSTVFLERPGGGGDFARITFHYKIHDEYVKVLRKHGNNPPAFMHELVADWDVEDDPDGTYKGMPEPFSLEALQNLQKTWPRALRSMLKAYNYEVTGAAMGNF